MGKYCLCNECLNNLIEVLKEDNPDKEFNNSDPYISGNTPCIELSYIHENGNEYCEEIYASANYCCESGEPL